MIHSNRLALLASSGALLLAGTVACSTGSSRSAATVAISASGASTSGPATTPPSAPIAVPATATVPTLPVITLPAKPLTATATFGGGVALRVSRVAHGSVSGQGPGVIVGAPEVTFTIQLQNDSLASVNLNNVQVNVTYSAEQTPAVPTRDANTSPFSGSLPAGKSASATYAFSIPTNEQGDVQLTVGYAQGQPTVLLTGAAK